MSTKEILQEIFGSFPDLKVDLKVDDGFMLSIQETECVILDSEIEDYLDLREQIVTEHETSVYAPGYYEHLVDALDRFGFARIRLLPPDGQPIILKSQNERCEVTVSNASTLFLLAVFDHIKSKPVSIRHFRRRLRRVYRRNHDKRLMLSDLFSEVMTIKIIDKQANNTRTSLKSLANAALFNISYAKGVGLNLSPSWERNYYRLGGRRRQEIQFPLKRYNTDLVSYYQLALSSESTILSYILLYNILEYFYTSTNEMILQKRLQEKLTLPDFHYKNKDHLRGLAKLVRTFDQKTDEQRMLTYVLEQYFMPDEIIDWIVQYETEVEPYFSQQQEIMGKTFKIELNADMIYSALAKRIYHIRNVLVHNKEGENNRFIPFTGQEETLMKDMPLIRYLAEQMIIKTGEEI